MVMTGIKTYCYITWNILGAYPGIPYREGELKSVLKTCPTSVMGNGGLIGKREF